MYINVAQNGTVWQLSVKVFHTESEEYLCDGLCTDSGSKLFDEKDPSLLGYVFVLFIHSPTWFS
jgi:hypothetical protein